MDNAAGALNYGKNLTDFVIKHTSVMCKTMIKIYPKKCSAVAKSRDTQQAPLLQGSFSFPKPTNTFLFSVLQSVSSKHQPLVWDGMLPLSLRQHERFGQSTWRGSN